MKHDILKKKEEVTVGAPAGETTGSGRAYSNLGRRKRQKLTTKEKLIFIIPALALVVAALLILLLMKKNDTTDIGEPMVQYYAGSVSRISENAQIVRDGDNYTLSTNGSSQQLNNLPIYFTNRNAVMTTTPMVFCDPRRDESFQMKQFSIIETDDHLNLMLTSGDKGKPLQRGFLFDGEDIFIFLEPTVLKFNGYRWELPPLSYVEAVYNGDVMVFNYETKECFMEPPRTQVIAEIDTGDYSISLLNEGLTLSDGTKTLLFTRPDLLEPIL